MFKTIPVVATIILGLGLNAAVDPFVQKATKAPEAYNDVNRVSVQLHDGQLFYSATFHMQNKHNVTCVRVSFEPLAITESSISELVEFRDLDGRARSDSRTTGTQTLDHAYIIPEFVTIGGKPAGEPRWLELRTRHVCNGQVSEKAFDRIDLKQVAQQPASIY